MSTIKEIKNPGSGEMPLPGGFVAILCVMKGKAVSS